MKDYLIVIDMQKDFIDGALGTKEAMAILPKVEAKLKEFEGEILFTRDTHTKDYLSTREGEKLPVIHCVKGTEGWQIWPSLRSYITELPIDKVTFGSSRLAQVLEKVNHREEIGSITLIGLCTDICVISNAMLLKAFLPEVPIIVDAACCAGVTRESHKTALEAMKACQIEIINE